MTKKARGLIVEVLKVVDKSIWLFLTDLFSIYRTVTCCPWFFSQKCWNETKKDFFSFFVPFSRIKERNQLKKVFFPPPPPPFSPSHIQIPFPPLTPPPPTPLPVTLRLRAVVIVVRL